MRGRHVRFVVLCACLMGCASRPTNSDADAVATSQDVSCDMMDALGAAECFERLDQDGECVGRWRLDVSASVAVQLWLDDVRVGERVLNCPSRRFRVLGGSSTTDTTDFALCYRTSTSDAGWTAFDAVVCGRTGGVADGVIAGCGFCVGAIRRDANGWRKADVALQQIKDVLDARRARKFVVDAGVR